jgi:hypothetical protein
VENGFIVENGLSVRDFRDLILGRRIDDDFDTRYCRVDELGMSWHSSDIPVEFNAHPSGTSDCNGEFRALIQGGRVWNQISNCDFSFKRGKKINNTAPVYDGKNQIQWRNMGEGYVAACYIWYGGSRTYETDIVFEDSYSWSADEWCPSGKMDVQNIMAHESGHSVGCEDEYSSGCSEATMYGYVSYGETKKRTLSSYDEDCARRIY